MTPLKVGDRRDMTGFFTKALFLRGRSGAEVERLLGYKAGRMRNGWQLLFLERMPAPADFEFMGYSQMSGGAPRGHLSLPGSLTAEQSLARGIPQWKLKNPLPFRVVQLIGPGQTYAGNYV